MDADSYVDALNSALNEITRLHKQLAAKDAVIEKLRSALKPMTEGFYWLNSEHFRAAKEAIAATKELMR